ncbi:MAG TPA: cytochrome d ubiquinol oxidase subunit II, partial [Thermoleophilaceae bacterium]
ISTTLALPLFIAGIGIVMRGTLYALHSATEDEPDRRIEIGFAVSSILTPFALGTVVGAIAAGRVPVDGSKGDLVSSWTGGTSIAIGVLAVAVAAYLAAVYLAADAGRAGDRELEEAFRVRALVMAPVAGAAALAGLIVLHDDARTLWDDLTSGAALGAVVVSALAGVATIALVLRRRYSLGRVTAAGAVAAVIAGWGLAQRPDLLPGLPIKEAAAGHSSIVALLVALAVGALALGPSLAFLFTLVLRGRFDVGAAAPAAPPQPPVARQGRADQLLLAALAGFAVAALVMLAFDATWARVLGVAGLLGAIAVGAVALATLLTATQADDSTLG